MNNLVILDNGKSIGGVWSKEKIYPNLYAQVGYGMFEYSFRPMRNDNVTEDRYIAGETVHNYLNDFAVENDLIRRTRLETHVDQVEKLSTGEWRLHIAHSASIVCQKLIYASGPTSSPVIPQWPKKDFNQPIIHSSEVGTSTDALHEIDRATVVGAAKSSYDTVYLLLAAGKKVDWIIREDGSGPLAITPPRYFGFNAVDFCSTRAAATFSPSIMNTAGLWYRFFQRTAIGMMLTMLYWRIATWLGELHAGYAKSENASKLRPIPKGYGIMWANAGLGVASAPNYWKVFHAGDVSVHRTEIDHFALGNKIYLKNGVILSTDYVILCTGFEKSYRAFGKELRVECGLTYDKDVKWAKLNARGEQFVDDKLPYLKDHPIRTQSRHEEKALLHGPSRHYRRLIVPHMAARGDRSIYFPGLIHSIFTPLVSEFQALWGCAYMLGRLDLPDQEIMEQEVATWNVWTRKRYLAQGEKHAYAIYDYLSYIDTLARDLGIKTSRKSNIFLEMFAPYRPSDYNGLLDEFYEAEKKREARNAVLETVVRTEKV
ncbi:MAG: hypothetical protein LQ338_001593 [Usnochroma carphineum]|nr:MAG: hypothetical protein LQ338_001593 [Usnochroma carphineum]